MAFTRLRVLRILPLALVACAGLVPVGCSGDGVNTYTVPRTTDPTRDDGVKPESGEYRILGALYPADRPEWYFKFTGTAEQVASHEADFDKLAKSVKLKADPNAVPDFTLPTGWARTGPRVVTQQGVQIKTDEVVKFGPPAAPLEMTISYIPGGGTTRNLGRWAGQLGMTNLTEEKLKKATTVFDATGTKGLRVDLSGPKNPSGGGPFMGKQ